MSHHRTSSKLSIGTLLQSFVVGGIIVAGTALIANYFSPKLAGLWWSLPFTLVPATVALWWLQRKLTKDSSEYQKTGNDLTGLVGSSIPSLFVLVIFLLVWFWLLKRGVGYWKSLLGAFLVWILAAGLYWVVICPSPLFHNVCIPVAS